MLVDTDVLIWHLRGFPEATRQLDSLSKRNISTMTWMELLQGFRNRAEMIAVQSSLKLRKAERLPVTRDISERAVL